MPKFNNYTRIAGLSQVRRLPRVGKLRLGVTKKSQKGNDYPAEVSYFVVKAEDCATEAIFRRFQQVYGETPTELDIMFPVENAEVFFPQSFRKYAATGLVCKGDGVTCSRLDRDTGKMMDDEDLTCPTPEACDFAKDDKGRTVCKRIASLVVLLPKVTFSGAWQIDTSSFNSIVDINSAIDYFRGLLGRIALVPLKLRRVAMETQYEGKKATHYPMQLGFPDSREEALQLGQQFQAVRAVFDVFRQIEAPDEGIPEDLYPKDVVRQAKRAIPAPSGDDPRPEFDDEDPVAIDKLPVEPGLPPERAEQVEEALAGSGKTGPTTRTAGNGGARPSAGRNLF